MTVETEIKKHIDHAQGYLMLKMYDDAIAEVDRVLLLAPQNADALYWKGMVLLEQGKLAEAETPFRRIVEIDPEQAHVYVHLAYIYRRTISLEKAIVTIQQALQLNPALPIALYNLACYRAVQGQAQESLLLLRQAISAAKECRELARTDPDFDSVRGQKEFQTLLEI